jgi:hypothetical protein
VTVGADFRNMFHYSKDHFEYPDFFQMQGSFYAEFQADDRLLLYLDRGMSQSNELFALAYILPWTGYVKVGRFTPSYGWKFDDHTAFVRQGLGLMPPGQTDTGTEIGISPGRLDAQAGVVNGALGSSSDDDKKLAEVVNATVRGHVSQLGYGLGGSYWHNEGSVLTRSSAGPHASLKLGRAIWLGEADWSRVESPGVAPHTEWLTSHEATYEALTGIYLRATYDFFDPDTKLKTGARVRYGVGLDALPIPSLGIKAMWNIFRNRAGQNGVNAALGDEYEQLEIQLHVFY